MPETSNAPMMLTPEELARITKRKRPAAQARVLQHLGIYHLRHPIDGSVVVGRAAALKALTPATDSPGMGREEASNGLKWGKQA